MDATRVQVQRAHPFGNLFRCAAAQSRAFSSWRLRFSPHLQVESIKKRSQALKVAKQVCSRRCNATAELLLIGGAGGAGSVGCRPCCRTGSARASARAAISSARRKNVDEAAVVYGPARHNKRNDRKQKDINIYSLDCGLSASLSQSASLAQSLSPTGKRVAFFGGNCRNCVAVPVRVLRII